MRKLNKIIEIYRKKENLSKKNLVNLERSFKIDFLNGKILNLNI